MRSAKSMLAAIGRLLPGLTRREWGALAIAAARRAGLEGADVRELSDHLEDQWEIDGERPSRRSA